MSFKSLIVTALMMILIAIPAWGDVRVEWDSGVNLSSSATASVWDWQTGFRTSGDWTLAPNLSLFLRDRVVRDSRNEDWYGDLERGYLQYESGPVRVKLGRQAVNWGIGWFFRPNDLITPEFKLTPEKTYQYMTWPGMNYTTKLYGVMGFAEFMKEAGFIKKAPQNLSEIIWENVVVGGK